MEMSGFVTLCPKWSTNQLPRCKGQETVASSILHSLGGSIFSQVIGNNNGDSPDVECVEEMPAFVECMNKLLKSRKLLAYHDRSDGGLITTLCEMAFASRLGLDINLKSVISEKSELLNFLFNEELGIVIQIYSKAVSYTHLTLPTIYSV